MVDLHTKDDKKMIVKSTLQSKADLELDQILDIRGPKILSWGNWPIWTSTSDRIIQGMALQYMHAQIYECSFTGDGNSNAATFIPVYIASNLTFIQIAAVEIFRDLWKAM